MATNGPWTDFITDFLEYTQAVLSPDIFKLWSGISLVAGALERRVWAKTGPRIAFPNLYTLLVAPPGVGKLIVEEVRSLWTEAIEPGTSNPAFHVAPDSMTKASLMDTLAKSKQLKLPPSGPSLVYHSLLVAAEEFSVLLPAYDMEYIGSLNSIYNNKPLHEEVRRYGPARELRIENPQLNLLGGAQPSWLATIFPEEAWSTGIARRIIMIYSSEAPLRDIFWEPELPHGSRAALLRRLGQISQLYGEMKWRDEAAKKLGEWHMAGGPPVPSHSKLVHYNRSRTLHAIKLSTISAISRSGERIIELVDVERALNWLFDAEAMMPDIFRAMIGKSDRDVLGELHLFATAMFARTRKPVQGDLIRQFLLERVPHDKVESLMLAADRAQLVVRMVNTDTWVPKARQQQME